MSMLVNAFRYGIKYGYKPLAYVIESGIKTSLWYPILTALCSYTQDLTPKTKQNKTKQNKSSFCRNWCLLSAAGDAMAAPVRASPVIQLGYRTASVLAAFGRRLRTKRGGNEKALRHGA
ncbi:hypothetical protein FPOAC2_11102 [Fusarium poae]